jgi:hypothetical protein
MGPKRLGDLHGKRTYTTRGTIDENPQPGPYLTRVAQ